MTMTPEVESALMWARGCGYNTVSDYPSTAIEHVHTLAAAVRAQREELAQLRYNLSRCRCAEHAMDASHAWGCPGCVADLRAQVQAQASRRCETCDHYVQRMNCCEELGDGVCDVTPEQVHGTCGAWEKLETGV